MAFRALAVLGVGSLRCGPVVVASVAGFRPEGDCEVRLFDANEERLDLMDRFGRVCMEVTEARGVWSATSALEEALEGADAVVLCVGHDCAVRLCARSTPEPAQEEEPDAPRSIIELVRGDLNRPTPADELSAQTRSIVQPLPLLELSREEAIAQALGRLLDLVPTNAEVLSLMRGVALPEGHAYTQLNWPPRLPEDAVPRVPHQLLRWILGDESVDDYVRAHTRTPVVDWLEAL